MNKIILPHGGYRNLKSYQTAEIIHDFTAEFCERYMTYRTNKSYRTYDQMVQAARSGKQNIAEGCQVSGTSKKTELKPETAANAAICLVHQANFLLDRQLQSLEKEFLEKGGFTERLYQSRKAFRESNKSY